MMSRIASAAGVMRPVLEPILLAAPQKWVLSAAANFDRRPGRLVSFLAHKS